VGEAVDAIECRILYAQFMITFLSGLGLEPSGLVHALSLMLIIINSHPQ